MLTLLKSLRSIGFGRRGLYKCDCGIEKIYLSNRVNKGYVKSCGCLRDAALELRTKHGNWYSSTYKSWDHMIQRCTNINNTAYHYYGGRDIKVCDKWLKFENFYGDMGDRPEGTSLDRIDNNKGYNRENCRWISIAIQAVNRRSYNKR